MKVRIWCERCGGIGIWCIECGRKGYTEKDLVELDPDQSLPEISVTTRNDDYRYIERLINQAKKEVQDEMKRVGWRKIKEYKGVECQPN